MLAATRAPIQIDDLIASLAANGYAIALDFLDSDLVARLLDDCRHREATGAMARASIGRDEHHLLEQRVRRVDASWLDGSRPGETAFLALAERLRLEINRQLFLGLFEFEAQFLTYPPGGFYRRHLDSLAGSRNRIVSLVAYLNTAWEPAHGGELDVWTSPSDDGEPVATVAPRAGTLVLMLSEEIPHAVRAAHETRRVIAGWFRVNASSANRIDPAR